MRLPYHGITAHHLKWDRQSQTWWMFSTLMACLMLLSNAITNVKAITTERHHTLRPAMCWWHIFQLARSVAFTTKCLCGLPPHCHGQVSKSETHSVLVRCRHSHYCQHCRMTWQNTSIILWSALFFIIQIQKLYVLLIDASDVFNLLDRQTPFLQYWTSF